MDKETRAVLNNERLIKARDGHFSRLKSLYAGEKSGQVFILDGIYGVSDTDPYTNPEKWVDEALESLAKRAEKIADPVIFKPLCLEFGLYGVHFIDRMLGAEVFFQDEQWYNRYLKSPIGSLEFPGLENDDTWGLAKRTARAFLKQDVSLPLFGLPTIASVLNIGVNLYGEEILTAMYLEPENARHDFRVISDLLCSLHRWYLENIPLKQLQPVLSAHRTQPHGFGQLCGCTTQLVSPEIYRDFIAPLDDELLSLYPNGGMIHLCGSHTQHIPVWHEMKSLRALQLNDRAAEDLEHYFNELREDQVIYLNPCEGMTVDKAMKITGGSRLVVVDNLDKPLETVHSSACSCCSSKK